MAALAAGTGYVLAHEGGHALALAAFGVQVDIRRSDFLGLRGQPGVAGAPTARERLVPWQNAIVSAGGDILPTLLDYLLFALWISAPGRRLRSRSWLADALISLLVGVFLLAHFGWVPATMGLVTDPDHLGLVRSVGQSRALVDAVIWLIAVVKMGQSSMSSPGISWLRSRRR